MRWSPFPLIQLLTPFRIALGLGSVGLAYAIFGPSESAASESDFTSASGIGMIVGTLFMCGLLQLFLMRKRATAQDVCNPFVFPPAPFVIGLAMLFIRRLPQWQHLAPETQSAFYGFELGVCASMGLYMLFGKDVPPPDKRWRRRLSNIGLLLAGRMRTATQPIKG